MPLGEGIWDAVRDRVEVSGQEPTWRVTAGSFDSALAYARERFGAPAVLAREDRSRWWPRVTLTVTTDATLAGTAPPLTEMSRPVVREPVAVPRLTPDVDVRQGGDHMPASLEAIFAHQEAQRVARGVAD